MADRPSQGAMFRYRKHEAGTPPQKNEQQQIQQQGKKDSCIF